MKILKIILDTISLIAGYLIMVSDRLICAAAIGVDLPSYHYTKGIPEPTEETPEDLKREINEEKKLAKQEFIKGYIRPAGKRVLIAYTLITLYLVFTKTSWFTFTITLGSIITTLGLWLIFVRLNRNRLVKKYLSVEIDENLEE